MWRGANVSLFLTNWPQRLKHMRLFSLFSVTHSTACVIYTVQRHPHVTWGTEARKLGRNSREPTVFLSNPARSGSPRYGYENVV